MLLEQVKQARLKGVPLIGISTPDQIATVANLAGNLNGKAPKFLWDCANGTRGLNKDSEKVLTSLCGGQDPAQLTQGLPDALVLAQKLPQDSLLFLLNGHLFLDQPLVIQCVSNLRDTFKADGRTLFLLAPEVSLKPELFSDFVLFDEPLPTEKELEKVVSERYAEARVEIPTLKNPEPELMKRAVDALLGTAIFPAEQIASLSMTTKGIDTDALWERKRKIIDATKGLTIYRGTECFNDIGGVENAKQEMRWSMNSDKVDWRVVLFIDELDKGMAAADTDTSGTTQYQLQLMLTKMQDLDLPAYLYVGPPGATKSMLAKAVANEAGRITIQMDLGAMKGSLVGESEQLTRQAWKVIEAVSGGKILVIATCNRHVALKPELKRRFEAIFYFDLPTAEERAAIWKIWLRKYDLSKQAFPNDEGWTGAEIKTCCKRAYNYGISLVEASKAIVPVAKAQAATIAELRQQAAGVFISASHEGTYEMPSEASSAALPSIGRKISMGS